LRRPPALNSTLRILAPACALAALALGAFAPGASAHLLTPQSGSPNTNRISDLYTVTLVIAAIIFVIVEGTLFYAVIRFRKRKGRVAAQIHGNTRLEISWTLGAAVILIALAALTFAELDSIRNPPNSPANGLNVSSAQFVTTGALAPPDRHSLSIQVNGQQYIWRYTYLNFGTQADQLDDPYSYETMVVPTNTVVNLYVVSQDVVHSFWIPDLVPKLQAVPGYVNPGWFIASKPGDYKGQCAFICGLGHARMIADIVAVPPAQFQAWIKQQKREILSANQAQAIARARQQDKTGASAVEVQP
jgi:cytochrome c oxidase subunit 2